MVSSQLEYCKQIKHSCNHKCTYSPMSMAKWMCAYRQELKFCECLCRQELKFSKLKISTSMKARV